MRLPVAAKTGIPACLVIAPGDGFPRKTPSVDRRAFALL
jgi:hypothetical protein